MGPIDDETLVARKLGEVGSGLYAARSYVARAKQRIDPEDLSGQAVIGFHQSLAELPAAEWLARRSRNATVVMRCRDASDLLSAARAGAGIAVLPCFLADAEPSLVRLTQKPVASRRVSLVYRKAGIVPAELRAAIDFIVEAVRTHAAELRG